MMRPSPVVATLPETSACALSGRQLTKFGVTLGGTIGSMKAEGSTGAKSPERFRSAVIDLRDVLAELVDAAGRADEGRDGDRHRLDRALRDVDAKLRHRPAGESNDEHRRGQKQRSRGSNERPASQTS